jgi:hypothetical protein
MEAFENIGFSGHELIENLKKHGSPRPLVVLLKKANTRWKGCYHCDRPLLSLYSPSLCGVCSCV